MRCVRLYGSTLWVAVLIENYELQLQNIEQGKRSVADVDRLMSMALRYNAAFTKGKFMLIHYEVWCIHFNYYCYYYFYKRNKYIQTFTQIHARTWGYVSARAHSPVRSITHYIIHFELIFRYRQYYGSHTVVNYVLPGRGTGNLIFLVYKSVIIRSKNMMIIIY